MIMSSVARMRRPALPLLLLILLGSAATAVHAPIPHFWNPPKEPPIPDDHGPAQTKMVPCSANGTSAHAVGMGWMYNKTLSQLVLANDDDAICLDWNHSKLDEVWGGLCGHKKAKANKKHPKQVQDQAPTKNSTLDCTVSKVTLRLGNAEDRSIRYSCGGVELCLWYEHGWDSAAMVPCPTGAVSSPAGQWSFGEKSPGAAALLQNAGSGKCVAVVRPPAPPKMTAAAAAFRDVLMGFVLFVWLYTCACHRPRQAPAQKGALEAPLNAPEPTVSAAAAAMSWTTSQRLPLFDNAKALLVYVVICCHTSFTIGKDSRGVSGFTSFGYMFVMPGFAFISGHVSNPTFTRRRAIGTIGMLVVFLTFQFLSWAEGMALFSSFKHTPTKVLPLPMWTAEGVTWFLACLCAWRFLHPFFSLLKYPLCFAVAVGLLSPFVYAPFNWMPIFAFWPYFVWGSVTKRETLLSWSEDKRWKAVFWVLAVLFTALSAVFPDSLVEKYWGGVYMCFYSTDGVGQDGVVHDANCYDPTMYAVRVGFYVLSVPIIVGFLAACPKAESRLTNIGKMSLYIYLCHPFLIPLFFIPYELGALFAASPSLLLVRIAFELCAVLLLWTVLSLPCMRYCCNVCVEPPIEKCFRAPEQCDDVEATRNLKVETMAGR
eukprot:SAG22_NODE_874_length_6717_cov_3.925808_2_plen_654_part_00